jgi:phosphatidylglycerol:prolipoprotein diacylglycerol transferase
MMFMGILTGAWLLHRKYKKEKVALAIQVKLFILTAIATMVGGRLFYLLFYKEITLHILIEMFTVWKVGMVSLGGFLFGILTLYFLTKRYRLDFMRILDLISPPIAIGMFFARIGCFLAGCCHGVATDLPWGIVKDTAIHPTQIYSSLYNLIIFLILTCISERKHRKGTVFAWFLILYGISRFLVEFIRVNPDIILGLSVQQLMSFLMVVLGIIILNRRPR